MPEASVSGRLGNMGFVHNNYLLFLLFGLVPIIIHYLMRFRSLKVEWGADYVLQRALERMRKKLYWEQIVLIALRMLACLLLVLAFARPISKKKSGLIQDSGVQHVIVLDGSYSMLADSGKGALWHQAKAAIEKLVKTWGRGERWSLVLAGNRAEWIVADQTISDAEDNLKVIRNLDTSESGSSMAKALRDVFDRYPGQQVDVYIFADSQASAWKGIKAVEMPENASVCWFDPGLQERRNLAVTKVCTAARRGVVDHPNRIYATIRNFGEDTVSDLELECLADDRFLARETVTVVAGQEVTLSFPVTFSAPGSHHIQVRLGKDVLAYDNSLSCGIDVAKSIRCLALIDPRQKTLAGSVTGALAIAGQLQNIKDDDDEPVYSKGPFTFDFFEDPGLPDLAAYDVVILDGARTVNGELADRLARFVERGGGLLLAPDLNTDLPQWNEQLAKVGLLPARLDQLVVETLGGKRFQSLDMASFSRGSLRPFASGDYGDISKSKFYNWFTVKDIQPGTVVQGVFRDQNAMLLAMKRGRGVVLMTTAPLNGQGSNLIVKEFYLPFIYGLLAQGAEGGVFPRTLATNQPIRCRLPEPDAVRAITVNMPGQDPVPIKVSTSLVYPAGSPVSGLCSLLLVLDKGNRRVWYGVQGERMDSDLTPMTSELGDYILKNLHFKKVGNWHELQQLLTERQTGAEFYSTVIALLLVVLIAEMLLQRRFL